MKKALSILIVIMTMLFFVSWYEPFYLELIPPINVKKVTQVYLKPDGTESKVGQTIREFSRSGQLIKHYEIVHGPYYAGPYVDSVIATLPIIGYLNFCCGFPISPALL